MRGNDMDPQPAERAMALAGRVEEYDIVNAPDVKTLKGRVAEAIRHGWQPRGGIAMAQEGLCQVVVK
jgi:hypothetical protein